MKYPIPDSYPITQAQLDAERERGEVETVEGGFTIGGLKFTPVDEAQDG